MAYDLVTGQRTFYIGVSGLADKSLTEIPFRDSAGNEIKCSYFRITGRTSEAAGVYGAVVAELSGVSHTGDMVTDALSAVQATVPASGICGVGFVGGPDGDAEWHGSNGQVCTGIKVQVQCEDVSKTVAIGITYGNLYGLNSMRLEQSYDAGV
jgi:hypothetical protein